MAQLGSDFRRASLRIPKPELRQVDTACILHRRHEIFTGDRLSVVSREIKVRTSAKLFRAQHRVHHADDFGALVIDRRCVEIPDFHVAVGTDRVSERPRILRKLRGA